METGREESGRVRVVMRADLGERPQKHCYMMCWLMEATFNLHWLPRLTAREGEREGEADGRE